MSTARGRRRTVGFLLTVLLVLGAVVGVAAPASADAGYGPPTSEIVDSTGQPGRTVALTFDDGPDPRNTPRLLDVLAEHQVTAVFCLVGDRARQHPDLVRRIVAEGHVLCNHSQSHDDLSTLSWNEVRADLLSANDAIHAAVPSANIPYFRAPYGFWGWSQHVAPTIGMQPLGWRVAVPDWEQPGTDLLVSLLLLGIGLNPGAVVLLHDGGGDRTQTVEAVDTVIPLLRADGWRFTLPAPRA